MLIASADYCAITNSSILPSAGDRRRKPAYRVAVTRNKRVETGVRVVDTDRETVLDRYLTANFAAARAIYRSDSIGISS